MHRGAFWQFSLRWIYYIQRKGKCSSFLRFLGHFWAILGVIFMASFLRILLMIFDFFILFGDQRHLGSAESAQCPILDNFWGDFLKMFWRFFDNLLFIFTGDHFFNSRRFLGFAQSHRERVQVGQRLRLLPVQAGIFLFYDFPNKSFHKVQLSWEGYKNLAQSIFLKVLTLQSNNYPVRDIKKQFSNSRIQSASKCLWNEKQCLNVFLK